MNLNSGLHTKIKAINSYILSKDDLSELNKVDNIRDLCDRLGDNKSYSNIINITPISYFLESDFENYIWLSLYNSLSNLYKFADSKSKKVLELFIQKYKIELLKKQYLCIKNSLSLESFVETLKKLNINIFNDILPCLLSKSKPELLETLKQTNLKKFISKSSDSFMENEFKFDMFLDTYHLSTTWKKIKELHNSKSLVKDYGIMIDVTNIEMIYRIKRYYDTDTNFLYSVIIPIHYKLTKTDINKMIESSTLEDFINSIEQTYYKNKININNIDDFFSSSGRILEDLIKKESKDKDNLVLLLRSYIHNKADEIHSLINIFNIKNSYLDFAFK